MSSVCTPKGVALGDLAEVDNTDGTTSLAKVIDLERDVVSLQVYARRQGSVHRRRGALSGPSAGRGLLGEHPRADLPRLRRAHRRRTRSQRRSPNPRRRPHREPGHAGDAHENDRDPRAHDRPVQLPGGEPEDPDLLGRRRALQRAARAHRLSGQCRCRGVRGHGAHLRRLPLLPHRLRGAWGLPPHGDVRQPGLRPDRRAPAGAGHGAGGGRALRGGGRQAGTGAAHGYDGLRRRHEGDRHCPGAYPRRARLPRRPLHAARAAL